MVTSPAGRRTDGDRPEIGDTPRPGRGDAAAGDDAAARREYDKALRPTQSRSGRISRWAGSTSAGGSPRGPPRILRGDPDRPGRRLRLRGSGDCTGDGGQPRRRAGRLRAGDPDDPDLAVAYVGQGAVLARLHRPDEAIAACSRAIALDGKNAKAYFNRGVAREAKNDTAGAAQDFQKAFQLDPRLKDR